MIELRNVNKSYVLKNSRTVVARELTFTFPSGQSIGLLGRNGAGKSSLLRMIAGTVLPDSGEILSTGSISWPVGFAGSFHPELSGAQNVRFVARLYGVDSDAMIDFVRDFAELGEHFHLPVRSYSSGMRSRLAFGMSMAVPFDTYLIDEVTAVGDAAFSAKSKAILKDRLEQSGAIIVSHSMRLLRRLCTAGALLHEGQLFYYDDINEAIEHHEVMMRGALPSWMWDEQTQDDADTNEDGLSEIPTASARSERTRKIGLRPGARRRKLRRAQMSDKATSEPFDRHPEGAAQREAAGPLTRRVARPRKASRDIQKADDP